MADWIDRQRATRRRGRVASRDTGCLLGSHDAHRCPLCQEPLRRLAFDRDADGQRRSVWFCDSCAETGTEYLHVCVRLRRQPMREWLCRSSS